MKSRGKGTILGSGNIDSRHQLIEGLGVKVERTKLELMGEHGELCTDSGGEHFLQAVLIPYAGPHMTDFP